MKSNEINEDQKLMREFSGDIQVTALVDGEYCMVDLNDLYDLDDVTTDDIKYAKEFFSDEAAPKYEKAIEEELKDFISDFKLKQLSMTSSTVRFTVKVDSSVNEKAIIDRFYEALKATYHKFSPDEDELYDHPENVLIFIGDDAGVDDISNLKLL